MAINKRNLDGNKIQDSGLLDNLNYSEAAGGQKVSEIGRKLSAMDDGTGAGFTTNATVARQLPSLGRNVAVYNNDTLLHSITLGEDNTIVAKAAGVTDAQGHVGIPCPPGAWTYLACSDKKWLIADSANLLVFLIDDNTFIKQEASR